MAILFLNKFRFFLKPQPDVKLLLANTAYTSKDTLNSFSKIDSISVKLFPKEHENWVIDDYNFSGADFRIFLVRGRKQLLEIRADNVYAVHIASITRKARKDDRLVIEYLPEWKNNKGESWTMCGAVATYNFGTAK